MPDNPTTTDESISGEDAGNSDAPQIRLGISKADALATLSRTPTTTDEWTLNTVAMLVAKGGIDAIVAAHNAALAAERDQVKRIADFSAEVVNKSKDLQSQLNEVNEQLRLYAIRIVDTGKQLATSEPMKAQLAIEIGLIRSVLSTLIQWLAQSATGVISISDAKSLLEKLDSINK